MKEKNEFLELIMKSIIDGEISKNKREFLFRKGEKIGLEKEEVEIYIDDKYKSCLIRTKGQLMLKQLELV